MDKKERKILVRHDRHVLNNSLKIIVDKKATPEESEDILYEKKIKNGKAKRG